jgi:4-carboxymuconolactone decarboxylase
MKRISILIGIVMALCSAPIMLNAQDNANDALTLNAKQQAIVGIAAVTAKGDLSTLKKELNAGLDAGLTINQIKEVIVHIYAYAGFPRSIRGLQTFMTVLDERKAKGISDIMGVESSPITGEGSKYERGKRILEKLTGMPETGSKTGYAAFAPQIEIFLKEHLFADLFERDILTYAERELVTISVLSSIGGVEPMLHSHLNICLHVGLTAGQLQQFIEIIKRLIGKKEADSAKEVLEDVIAKNDTTGVIFPRGDLNTSDNFKGEVWVKSLVDVDSSNETAVGNVTFAPGARSKWHLHPAGQILLATGGVGYYQEKGKAKIILRKGDVIRCPSNIPHWHGASADSVFIQIAITGREKGPTQWLESVTDEEYRSAPKR